MVSKGRGGASYGIASYFTTDCTVLALLALVCVRIVKCGRLDAGRGQTTAIARRIVTTMGQTVACVDACSKRKPHNQNSGIEINHRHRRRYL